MNVRAMALPILERMAAEGMTPGGMTSRGMASTKIACAVIACTEIACTVMMSTKMLASVFPGLAPKGRRAGNSLMIRNDDDSQRTVRYEQRVT